MKREVKGTCQLVVHGYNIYCQTAMGVKIKCPLERAGKAWGERTMEYFAAQRGMCGVGGTRVAGVHRRQTEV